jgi:hypothetical protein
LWIHGYEFPDIHEGYDANWLYATAHYESASSSVWVVREPMILTWELSDWLHEIERLYQRLKGTATLACLEPYLFVELKAEHRNCLLREVVKGAYNRRLLYQLRRQSSQLPPPSVGSPRFARGTAQGFGSPCSQGEPAGGGRQLLFV